MTFRTKIANAIMSKPEICNTILAYLKELTAGQDVGSEIGPDTDLVAAGILDSLNIVRLIQFVETHFDLAIADADIGPDLFASANALAQYVVTKKR